MPALPRPVPRRSTSAWWRNGGRPTCSAISTASATVPPAPARGGLVIEEEPHRRLTRFDDDRGDAPSVKGIAEFARRAEALDYDYLGCGEYMMFHGPIGNSLIGLSVAAGVTTRSS
jgi:hypothetical protein